MQWDLGLLHSQHLGDRVAVGIDALGVGVDGGDAVAAEHADGAGGADRAVHLVGARVPGLERRHDAHRRGLAVGDDAILHRKGHERGGQIFRIGQRFLLLPSGAARQRAHRLDGLPFALGDHREIIAVAHDFHHARHFLDRSSVGVEQRRGVARRAHHAGMHHAVEAQILDEGDAAGDFSGNIDARHRLAHHGEVGGRGELARRLRLHMQRVAADDAAETQRLRSAEDLAALRGQRRRIDLEHGRRLGEQQLAHLGGGVAHRGARLRHRHGAGGIALIGRQERIGGDQLDDQRVDLQLFGSALEDRGLDPLPELGLAGEHGDMVVGVDPDPAVEHGGSSSANPAAPRRPLRRDWRLPPARRHGRAARS